MLSVMLSMVLRCMGEGAVACRVERGGRARTMVVMFVVDLADEAVESVGRRRAQ
jgi:hypothetical protein